MKPSIQNRFSDNSLPTAFIANSCSNPLSSEIDITEEKLEENADLFCSSNSVQVITPSYVDARERLSNSFAVDVWKATLHNVACEILATVSKSMRGLTVDELVHMSFISDVNAFGITSCWEDIKVIPSNSVSTSPPRIAALFVAGMGLFPQCAKLNHSCYPNCHVYLERPLHTSTSNPRVCMRTLRTVKMGDELADSYVDTYSDRDTRRKSLLHTKNFFCECERCLEPFQHSVDRFLDGRLCSNCIPELESELVESNFLPSRWSQILYEVGAVLVQKKQKITSKLRALAGLIIEDLEDLDLFPMSKQLVFKTNGECKDSIFQLPLYADVLAHAPAKDSVANDFSNNDNKYKFLYDPRLDPVLVPVTILPDMMIKEMLERGVEKIHSGPARCERCELVVEEPWNFDDYSRIESLWQKVVETMGHCQADPIEVRRRLGLFFKLYGRTHLHPFHVRMYRMSQRVVDTTVELWDSLCREEGSSVEEQLDFLLLDVALLRHQVACQSCVLPGFHEETHLTLRVLVSLLSRIIELLERGARCDHISSDSVNRAIKHCCLLFLNSKQILYGES